MNILASAMNFGLGPVGKLSSIVNYVNSKCDNINWYSCGDRFDLSIFDKNIFKDHCDERENEVVDEFVKKYNIKFAVVVLDFELAEYLEKIGVKVFYVDSLPFMWTEADPIPLNASYYFAQKCVNMNDRANKVISKVKNLIWVNPIIPCVEGNNSLEKEYDVVINLGGMDSPFGDGREYINTVLVNMVNALKEFYLPRKILVTCGSKAKENIKNILKDADIENLTVETLKQSQFAEAVKNCKLFLTSPGMTTIYETCYYNKDTIILPPQNLSQFYNIEFAKKLIKNLKTIEWNREDLSFNYLEKYFDLGEDELVKLIYTNISKAESDKNYNKKLFEEMKKLLKEPFISQDVIVFESNGTVDIVNRLLNDIKAVL